MRALPTLLIACFAGLSLLAPAPAPAAEPVTSVADLDLSRYAGQWYEIAHLPVSFQRQCAGDITATYALRADGRIGVRNACRTHEGKPAVAEGVISLGPVMLPMSRLYVVAFSIVVLVVLYVFLMHTKGGRALRAVVQDIEIANAQGIRSQFMYPLGFGIGVALAAVAGALMAPVFSVSPSIGATPLLKAFIVVILGGLGSIPGAALAALLLGVFESVANTFMSSSFSDMLLFGFVMLMLIFRPAGLLGKSGR